MQVYHGTALHGRMLEEGRLQGNPMRYSYEFRDAAVGRFAEIFSRLRGEAFRDYSLAYNIHDVSLALRMAEKLYPGVATADVRRRCADLTLRVNRLRAEAMRSALSMASDGGGFFDCTDLVSETVRQAQLLAGEIEGISRTVIARATGGAGRPERVNMFAPMKAAAAAVFSFCLAGASLGGCCKCDERPPPETAVETAVEMVDSEDKAEAGKPEKTGEPQAPPAQAPEPAPEPENPQEPDEAQDKPDSPLEDKAAEDKAAATSQPPAQPPTCSFKKLTAVRKKVKRIIKKVDPCSSIRVYFPSDGNDINVTRLGNYNVQYCNFDSGDTGALEKNLKKAFENHDLACLTGESIYIDGKESKEKSKLMSEVYKKCPKVAGSMEWYSLTIEVDGKGKVVDIKTKNKDSSTAAAAVACIKKALKGLSFPCMANHKICPEYVIIE